MTKKKDTPASQPQEDSPALASKAAPEPKRRSEPVFPIVGIGASAGGLSAFEAFFSGMPADTDPGMAFILIQHLAPDHKSLLTELIRRCTRMEVFEVEDGMEVRPNCTYIIPPNRDMAFLHGRLQLIDPIAPRGQRLPIDFFFRSLAQGMHESVIGVVLSGTGSDGTLGVRAIKGEGGMVIAQTPESCEYDGMPRSAIATGLVDYELPPSEMPDRIIAYAKHAYGTPLHTETVSTPGTENTLYKASILIRNQTGHDFSQYKPSTIHRRIERRMAVHQIDTMDAYIQYMQQSPAEVEALFYDLLIGVTRFFRDTEVFKVFEEQVIPQLFARKTMDSVIRIWSTGCSTGEEAYSIAILLQEYMEKTRQTFKVQIFATDIDNQAIATARSGLYPASIAADVSPERLARFFTVEGNGGAYRIHKTLRDILIFSEQDVIKDPPFSKLDCIVCRNLLIYMDGELQKKLIPLFHYALRPGGFLFLGTSETLGDFGDLFTTVDRKSKLYLRNEAVPGRHSTTLGRFQSPPKTFDSSHLRPAVIKEASPVKLPLRELTEQTLLQRFVPVGVLVNVQGDILYLHGHAGQYLEPAQGESGTNNILKMAREGLRRGLSTALHKARSTGGTVRSQALRVKTNGPFISVDLTVSPLVTDHVDSSAPLFLVTLEPTPQVGHGSVHLSAPSEGEGVGKKSDGEKDDLVTSLRQELLANEDYLQSTIEELETSNEELNSSNEEMQSINEELQSSNEELETSKEELQSVNEELATVNAELQSKLADLSQANNDMSNLLSGTGIATIFVDHQLCIMRFTPAATQIINLIPVDIGRHVGHIVSKLVGYDSLVEDVESVLETLLPKDLEVQAEDGKWYTMRIQPYRTLDNVIEGAVITFVDITEMKKSDELLQEAHGQIRLAVVARDSQDAITVLDMKGDILSWNPSAQRLLGWSEKEALSMNIQDMLPKDLQAEELENLRLAAVGDLPVPYETRRIHKDGQALQVRLTASLLVDDTGCAYGMATTQRIIQEADSP